MKNNILYLLLFVSAPVLAQSNRALRASAYEAMQHKDWYGAAQYYQRLYKRDSADVRNQLQYANASTLSLDVDVAIRLYKRMIEEGNVRGNKIVYYHLAECLKLKQRYKEARKWFLKYSKLKAKKEKHRYYKVKAAREAESCDVAQALIDNPVAVVPEHLEGMVNTTASEYAPLEVGNVLYFSSLREPTRKEATGPGYSKVYVKRPGKKAAVALDSTINARGYHVANACLAPDGSMFFSRCVQQNAVDYSCALYQSQLVNNKWQEASKLVAPLNVDGASTSQPNFGRLGDSLALFFSSNRPGGEGGMDIWYSLVNADGSFREPVNAGKKINSPEDDITPWVEQQTLYFSSTWHYGLGGFDIFKSKIDSGAFTDPTNVGYPINSSYNDTYYSSGGNHIYLASNRPGSNFETVLNCCSDLYRLTVDTLQKTPEPDPSVLLKARMKLLVPLTLYFHNDQPDPGTRQTVTTKDYGTTYREYRTLLPAYTRAYSKGATNTRDNVAEIEEFFADSVDGGMEALNKFIDLLQATLSHGEKVTITMKGYCSPLASTDYNINLAKRRISSLRNYFTATRNGYFKPYIDNTGEGARITFEEVDVGELPKSRVSDDFKDQRNSVYSPGAAAERKIQIIAVSFGAE